MEQTAQPADTSPDASGSITFAIRRGLIAFAVAATLVCLWYSWFTEQVWEDALITLRHGENLLHGQGLVYNPGERVHGFTSPVNVLLLTLCRWVTPGPSYEATFWLYRAFTIAAFVGGGVLLLRAMANVAPRWAPALWFLGVAYLFDSKSVAFSTNGMETGFVMLLVGWAIYLMTLRSADPWLARGLCWAGLMWARPDGCVLIAALSLAELAFLCQGSRLPLIKSLAKSAAACALLYAPWVAWAWWYYGSPIPHTVIAKANVEFGALAQGFKTLDDLLSLTVKTAAKTFRPIHFGENNNWLPSVGWTRAVNGLTKAVGVFALLYWVYPTRDRFGRACSFCFMILCLYLSYLPVAYPWYYPPVTMLGLAALARGATTFVDGATRSSQTGFWSRQGLALTALVILAMGQVGVFSIGAQEEQIRQTVVEDGCRAVVGSFIKEHANSNESIYLEPLGYIGYYSGLRMLDFPGLVSPEVVRIRRQEAKDQRSVEFGRVLIIPKLQADWVVLRLIEWEVLRDSEAAEDFKKNYHFVKLISVFEKLNEYQFLPGGDSLRFDSEFVVFRRNAAPVMPPALPPES